MTDDIKLEMMHAVDEERVLLNNNNDANSFVDPLQIFNDLDYRGFNLLLRAAEDGRTEVVFERLNFGFDVNGSAGDHTAASLAFNNGHFDTLLTLLRNNSKFPRNFNAERLDHPGLIEFNKMTEKFHEELLTENTDALFDLIDLNPDLRHYYSVDGRSAACVALTSKLFDSYEVLVMKNVLLSPDENYEDVYNQLDEGGMRIVRNIHKEHALPVPDNHLLIFNGSIFVGHDLNEDLRTQRLQLAQNAIEFLDTIPLIQPILKLIARAGGFKLVFDFKRKHTHFMDPTTSVYTRGIYYTTRYFFIGALHLLDSERCFDVFGTLAHELCHFAMTLVYDNAARPYGRDEEKEVGAEFHKILLQCQLNRIEDIINWVFDYSEDRRHAELIVRVPHMLAFYANNPDTLAERQQQFQPLFDYFETRVLPEIEYKIPTIAAELQQKREILLKNVSKWRKIAKFSLYSLPFCLLIAIVVTFLFVFKADLSFDGLSRSEQAKVINGILKFDEVELKLNELFDVNNKNFTKSLNSKQLRTLISGEILYLSDQQNIHLKQHISINVDKINEGLKSKFLNSRVNFQGQPLKFIDLIGDNWEIINSFDSDQIREILINDKEILKVGKDQGTKSEFYVERNFVEWENNENIKTFDEITAEANEKKIILLSDNAGAGKSTTFKNLVLKLKENMPNFWISYIDLKWHLKDFKFFQNKYHPKPKKNHVFGIVNEPKKKIQPNFSADKVFEILLKILALPCEFEIKLFTDLFKSNKTVLLLYGVDEIAPYFTDLFMNLVESLRKSTKNQFWIATKPHHREELTQKFKINAYKLDQSYNEEAARQLIREALTKIKVTDENLVDQIFYKLFDSDLETEYYIYPLLLEILTKLYNEDATIFEDSNFYSTYEKIVKMQKSILGANQTEIKNLDNENDRSSITIWQVYQIYALKLLNNDDFFDDKPNTINIDQFSLVQRWEKGQRKNWTPEKISRSGFLIVNKWNTDDEFPVFDHRIFADYFVAKFGLENLFDDNDQLSDFEVGLRIKFVLYLLEASDDDVALLIKSYHQKDTLNEKIFKNITTDQKIKNLIFEELTENFDTTSSGGCADFVRICALDERFLDKLRNEKNETLFQAAFRFHIQDAFVSFSPDFLLNLVEFYESALGSDWFQHTGYPLSVENFSIPSDEEIEKILSKDFAKKYDTDDDDDHLTDKGDCTKMLKIFNFLKRTYLTKSDYENVFELLFDHEKYLECSIKSKYIADEFFEVAQKISKSNQDKIDKLVQVFKQSIDFENYELHETSPTDDFLAHTNYFFLIFQQFFYKNQVSMPDIMKNFRMAIFTELCSLQKLKELYGPKYGYITQRELQDFLIRHSVDILESSLDDNDSNFDFVQYLRGIFSTRQANETSKAQLRKFLENRYDNEDDEGLYGHSVVSYMKYILHHRVDNNERQRIEKLNRDLLKLAKENGMSENDIAKSSIKNLVNPS